MRSLAVSQFKAKCIAELKGLQETGEELVITLRGKPVARVVPVCDGGRQLGIQAGSMEIRGDILASDLDDDFDAAESKLTSRRRKA
jgi:antitoxin (DNA-binding transcriptional repressor) of toxin-antitoxin stability system